MATLDDMLDTIRELGATGISSYREGQNSANFRSADDLIKLAEFARANDSPPTFDVIEIVDV